MDKLSTVYDIFPDIDKQRSYRNPADFPELKDPFFWSIYERFKPFSMIGVARFWNIYESMQYLARSDLEGDVVECGVFLGGAVGAALSMAEHLGVHGRTFWLFDTFEGFTVDVTEIDPQGNEVTMTALPNFQTIVEQTVELADPQSNKVRLVKGRVEDTLLATLPERVAFLRLDTDYYESTKCELEHLFPLLEKGGVLIVDDYGHFKGARRAVDEFMRLNRPSIMWHRVDYSCRSGVKF